MASSLWSMALPMPGHHLVDGVRWAMRAGGTKTSRARLFDLWLEPGSSTLPQINGENTSGSFMGQHCAWQLPGI
jgi:hypothetical protein